jgi:hypothetical protein
VRVSYVLLLTPFILACGRLSDCNPDHPIPLVYLKYSATNWETRASGRKHSPYYRTEGRVQITTLGVKGRGSNADTAGKKLECECDRGGIMEMSKMNGQ